MKRSWWFLATLAFAACKSKSSEAPSDAGASPAPPAAPLAPAAAAPAPAKKASEATVVYLETRGPTCVWIEQDPLGDQKRELFQVESSCGELKWAFAEKGDRAAVAVHREGVGYELSTIELLTLKATRQPSPPGTVAGIGFNPAGELIALIEAPDHEGKFPRVKEGELEYLVYEGERYEVAADGTPGLAHAYRLEGPAWKRIETKSTAYETDFAIGVEVLAAAKGMGLRGPSYSYELSAFESLEPQRPENAILTGAAGPRGEDEQGEWGTVKTGTITLYAWAEASEVVLPKGELYTIKDGRARPFPLPVEKSAYVELQARGPYLLLTDNDQRAWLLRAPATQPVARWKDVSGVTFRSPQRRP